jgi:hypothetical protein
MQFFFIVKTLLSLGERKLIEMMLSDEYYLFTFGCLECNYQWLILLDDPDVICI